MLLDSLLPIKSQDLVCQKVKTKVINEEAFILLTGESGSGRSSMLEKVINLTDSKCRAIYVPCKSDMTLTKLREIFLQQLITTEKFDVNTNLADFLLQKKIPTLQKILVCIDDIDDVIASFFEEIATLSDEFIGQNRFSFVASCKPIYAQALNDKLSNHKFALELINVKPLSSQEALELSHQIFLKNELGSVFKKIKKDIAKLLVKANGNISLIIKYSEMLMKEPIKAQSSIAKGQMKINAQKKKKNGSTGIFIAILIVAIALACLVPVFMGSGLFDDNSQNRDETAINPQAPNNDAFYPDNGLSTPTIDDGYLSPEIQGGLETNVPEMETDHQMVLDGKALQSIEKSEAEGSSSDYPIRGLGNNRVDLTKQYEKEELPSVNDKKEEVAPKEETPKAPLTEEDALPDNAYYVERGNNDMQIQREIALKEEAMLAQKKAAQEKALKEQQARELALKQQQEATKPSNNVIQESNNSVQASKQATLAAIDRALNGANQSNNAPKDTHEVTHIIKTPIVKDDVTSNIQTAKKETKLTPTPKKEEVKRPVVDTKLRAGEIKSYASYIEDNKQKSSNNRYEVKPYNASSAPLSSAAQNSELAKLNRSYYTVQISAGANRNSIVTTAASLTDKYYIYEKEVNGKRLHVLIMGAYETSRDAENAISRLPASLKQSKPFIKQISKVLGEMK